MYYLKDSNKASIQPSSGRDLLPIRSCFQQGYPTWPKWIVVVKWEPETHTFQDILTGSAVWKVLGFLTYRPKFSLELVLSENRFTGPGPRSRAPRHDALGGLVRGCGVSPRCLEPARWAPGSQELKILPPVEKHKSTAPLPSPKSDHSHRAQRKICINSMNKAGEDVSPWQASVGPPV